MSYGLELLEETLIDNYVEEEMEYRLIEAKEWATRDGRMIKVIDMETRHIQNCIRILSKRTDEIAELWCDVFRDELERRGEQK